MSTHLEVDDGAIHMTSARALKVVGAQLTDLGGEVAQLTIPLLFGTVDPTAGGGLSHPFPCLYLRANGSSGELWLSSGAAATAWTKVTVP